jgi:hypothetical protein
MEQTHGTINTAMKPQHGENMIEDVILKDHVWYNTNRDEILIVDALKQLHLVYMSVHIDYEYSGYICLGEL